jgi:hypothetical protein
VLSSDWERSLNSPPLSGAVPITWGQAHDAVAYIDRLARRFHDAEPGKEVSMVQAGANVEY